MWIFNWFKKIFTQKEKQQISKFNPRPECLKAIEDKSCVPDIYVCRHKCKDAYKCFKKHGQKAKVVKGRVEGLEDDHIWMELEKKGELYWYDPTWYNVNPVKYGCHKTALWTDRKVIRNEIHGIIKPTDDHSPPY